MVRPPAFRRLPRAVREQQVLDAAVAVFSRRGYHATTVDEIATAARLSKPMVYAYLGTKEELFIACLHREGARLIEAVAAAAVDTGADRRDDDPAGQISRGLHAFLGFVAAHRDGWSVLVRQARGQPPFAGVLGQLRARFAEILVGTLTRAAQSSPDFDLTIAGYAMVGAAEAVADWLVDHPEADPDSVATWLMTALWLGADSTVHGHAWPDSDRLRPAGYGRGMAAFIGGDLSGSRFERVNLSGSRFDRVDLTGVELRASDLVDTRLRGVELNRVVMSGVELVDVSISGKIRRLTVNGVDIGPLVERELDRRYPDRPKMRPTDAAGFGEAWDIVERLWAGTVDRARRLDPALLHESVDGEWSFIETLRHLAFASDAWIRRAILGDPSPWDPLDLPWDEMPDTPGIPRDRDARPSLDMALELRRGRMATVRQVIDDLTDESLGGHTEPVAGPGWPRPRSYPIRECLLVILNEEWEHRLFAERDLTVLEERSS